MENFLKNPEIVEFAKFLKRCKGKRVALVMDKDLDGICSGITLYEALKEIGANIDENCVLTLKSPNYFNSDTIKSAEKNGAEVIITTDLALDQAKEHVFEAMTRFEMGIIDHHWSSGTFVGKTNYLNSFFFQKEIEAVHYPASKIAFDLAKSAGTNPREWIAMIGMLADMAAGNWPEFSKKVFSEYEKDKLEEIKRRMDFARMSGLDNVKKIFFLLHAANSPEEILNLSVDAESLLQDAAINEKIFLNLKKKFFKKSERDDELKLIIFEFKSSKDAMASLLSNEISLQFAEYTIVFANLAGSRAFISLRNQSQKVDMNLLIRKALSGLSESNGGGHKPAAGASVKIEDLDALKKNIKAALNELKRQG